MKAIYDLGTNTWDVDAGTDATGCVLGFGFRHNGTLPVDLRDVASFGWDFGDAGEVFPKGGRMLSSALDVVVQKNLPFTPDTAYTITFFVERHSSGRASYVLDFTTPIPAAPYASWVWDSAGKAWIAPVPKPEEGAWVWDEATATWVPCPREAERVLAVTDAGMGRVVEDLIALLESGAIIQRTQLPQASQLRIAAREAAREVLRTASTKGTA